MKYRSEKSVRFDSKRIPDLKQNIEVDAHCFLLLFFLLLFLLYFYFYFVLQPDLSFTLLEKFPGIRYGDWRMPIISEQYVIIGKIVLF